MRPAPPDDLYARLDVEPAASSEELRRAYHRQALALHPDLQPTGDPLREAAFRRLAEAWEVLGDPQRRAAYDRQRTAPAEPDPTDPPLGTLERLLQRLFAAAGRRPEDGADLLLPLPRGLSAVLRTERLELDLPIPRRCPDCNGAPCADAQPACASCAGTGRLPGRSRVDVTIPAGVEDLTRLRLAGMGEPGLRGGRDGDLFIEIRLLPHPLLRREGRDLHLVLPLPVTSLALGGRLSLPGLEGPLELELTAGLQPGAELRVTGAGLSAPGGTARGDLVVTLAPEVPCDLDPGDRLRLQSFCERLRPEQQPAWRAFCERAGLDPTVPPKNG